MGVGLGVGRGVGCFWTDRVGCAGIVMRPVPCVGRGVGAAFCDGGCVGVCMIAEVFPVLLVACCLPMRAWNGENAKPVPAAIAVMSKMLATIRKRRRVW